MQEQDSSPIDADHKKGHGHGDFMSQAVRIVDYDTTNNNLLVRGSSAFGAKVKGTGSETDGTHSKPFVMADLISAIQSDSNYSSLPVAVQGAITASSMVIDFCLIGFVEGHKDQRIVNTEVSWFNASPPTLNGSSGPYPTYIDSTANNNSGMMVYWPIKSIGFHAHHALPTVAGQAWPAGCTSGIITALADNTGFNFAGLIPAIRNALTNNTANLPGTLPSGISNSIQNAIIYVHCDSGVNRTGAAVAGYLMQYGTAFGSMPAQIPATPVLTPPTGAPKYQLNQAQSAANANAPGNDSVPPGGGDIWVTEAYCNYLCNNNNAEAALSAWAVPNPVPYQPPVTPPGS